jgi:hypothetical protein
VWQAEPLVLLVIGASHLELGVCVGSRVVVWRDRLRLDIPEAAPGQAPGQCLLDALDELQRMLSAGQINDSLTKPASTGCRLLRVFVSERWLALEMIPWNSALTKAASVKRYLRKGLQSAGYVIAEDSVLRIDDRVFGEPGLTVAYPAETGRALAELATRQGLRLDSVLPLGVAACVDVLSNQPALAGGVGVVEGGWACFYSVQCGRTQLLSPAVRVDGSSGLSDMWRRLCLRHPAASGADFNAVTPGALSPSMNDPTYFPLLVFAARQASCRHPLDAIASRVRATRLQWLSLGVFAALLSGLLTLLVITSQQVARLEDRVAIQTRSAPPIQPMSRDERQRIVAVNQAVRELNLPVDALLKSLQPPKDIRVALIEIDLTASRAANDIARSAARTMKLVAEAGSGIDMTRYVAFLSDRPGIARAYLLRHEVVESEPAKPYRLTLEVEWKD